MDYEYEERYYKFRQIFSDYIIIYKSILQKKNFTLEQTQQVLEFIMLILEKHYFLNDYHIELRDDMFHFIKWHLINIK